MKLKKKHRKPRKQMSSVNMDIMCAYNDRLRVREIVLIPNLGQFICTIKDKASGTIKLKSVNFTSPNVTGFEFPCTLNIEVAPLAISVGESSSNPIVKSST